MGRCTTDIVYGIFEQKENREDEKNKEARTTILNEMTTPNKGCIVNSFMFQSVEKCYPTLHYFFVSFLTVDS